MKHVFTSLALSLGLSACAALPEDSANSDPAQSGTSQTTLEARRNRWRNTTTDAGAATTDTGSTTTDSGTTTMTTDSGTTATATSTLFFDDMQAGIGNWTDWFASPGWVWPASGTLAITPPAATHPAPLFDGDYDYTHSALAAYCPLRDSAGRCLYPTPAWANVAYEMRMNTLSQTRTATTGNQPNAWEVGWMMFRFRDVRHYYYVHYKAHHLRDLSQDYGGIEIGKYNCSSTCGLYEQAAGQEVLWNFSAADLAGTGLSYLTLGQWYDFRVETRDVILASGRAGVRIVVYINGIKAADVVDDGTRIAYGHSAPTPPVTGGGSVTLYAEDADVRFDNVRVTQLAN